MAELPPPVMRPNGKTYQPSAIMVRLWENDHSDNECGVVVLGTHDVEKARALAQAAVHNGYAIAPCVGWWRDSFYCGIRAWVTDPVRGRAGVMFTESDDPEEMTT